MQPVFARISAQLLPFHLGRSNTKLSIFYGLLFEDRFFTIYHSKEQLILGNFRMDAF